MQGETNKKGLTGLSPQVNDVIIYKDHNNQPRFGIIQRVLEKNKVLVKTTHYKKIDQLEMHIRKISLIYRPKENLGHFPLNLDIKGEQINSVMNKDISIDELLALLK